MVECAPQCKSVCVNAIVLARPFIGADSAAFHDQRSKYNAVFCPQALLIKDTVQAKSARGKHASAFVETERHESC